MFPSSALWFAVCRSVSGQPQSQKHGKRRATGMQPLLVVCLGMGSLFIEGDHAQWLPFLFSIGVFQQGGAFSVVFVRMSTLYPLCNF